MAYQNYFKGLFKNLLVFSLASLSISDNVFAQLIPDNTTNTQFIPNLIIQGISSELITNGTIKGTNLFHSFLELNVPVNRGLYISNPANITNIFTRVTGSNPSNILGRLGVLGNANLFLLNPNGVLFGENSSLALGGSLYVTTSDRVRFADGSTFSTKNPESSSVLSSSIPIGLGFSSNSGSVIVRSQAAPISPLPLPPEILQVIRAPSGLITSPNTTMALIGNQVSIENNGSLFALGSQIEISAISNGEVTLIPYGNRFKLSYDNITNLGNIAISNNARVSSIGTTGGDINITGNRVVIKDIGLISSGSLSKLFSGKISVKAEDQIELIGSNKYEESVRKLTSTTPDTKTNNGFFSFSAGDSNGGDINLEAPKLIMRDGAFIVSSILLAGKAGNINIKAPQSVTLSSSAIFSGTAATGTGLAGNVDIKTGSLLLNSNAVISSTSLGAGQGGGNVFIDAKKSIEVLGNIPIFTVQNIPITGGIITSTFSNAIAGNIQVNTPYLSIRDGAVFTTETSGKGNGGNVSVKANRIDLSGIDPTSQINSSILAVTREGSTGNGGNVNIVGNMIKIQDGATASVASFGLGRAGNLSITSDQLLLKEQGNLLASSIFGDGGNISLQIRDLLLLQNNSQILASAGTGNGGNININAGIVVGLNGSQINANALIGNGGNIFINTKGLFFSSDSSITASSKIGISGNVSIFNFDFSTNNIFVSSEKRFVKVDAIISNSCLAKRNATQGSFVVTGSGGLPENPNNLLVAEYPATQIQAIPNSKLPTISPNTKIEPLSTSTQKDEQNWNIGDPIVEVRGLVKSKNGDILPVVSYADVESLRCSKN